VSKLALSAEARTALLFLAGLALTINEVAIESPPVDPTLLVFYGGMMGLGPVLSRAERRSNGATS
jgi:hypothetical protein